MRLGLIGQSIDDQIDELQRDLEEIKSLQFTSQDSGMLAHLARAQLRDQYGDIVELSGDFTPATTSQIQLPATPSSFQLNTLYADQIFIPKHGKPAVAIPLLKLKATGAGGIHGESELFVSAQWGITMKIYNGSNVQIGSLGINQSLGGLFEQVYHPTYDYAWQTMMVYECSSAFTLSYEFVVRSSDDGTTSSEIMGYFQ